MKKLCIATVLLAAGGLMTTAQSKLDMRAGSLFKAEAVSKDMQHTGIHTLSPNLPAKGGIKMVETIIEMSDPDKISDLESLGVKIVTTIDNYAVCQIPLNNLVTASRLDNVKSISLSRKHRFLNDLAREATNVDAVHSGSDGTPSYKGDGVIFGLFDSGIDPNHINFNEENSSQSRVKQLWQYILTEDDELTTKSFLSPSAISSFTTDDIDGTHGTHVLGIAAGSYDGNSSTTRYYGMAPHAEIAVACGDATDAAILDGVQKIIEYAESQNKPCAINLSLGSNLGHHDGSDSFNKALDKLAQRAPIFIAAGNEGNLDIAIKKTMTSTDKEIKTFLVPNATLKSYYQLYQAVGDVEILCEDNTPFKIEVALYDTSTEKIVYRLEGGHGSYKYVTGSITDIRTDVTDTNFTNAYQSTSHFGSISGIISDNGRYGAFVNFDLIKKNRSVKILPAIIITGVAGKKYEVYGDGYFTEFSANGISGWDEATADGTINEISCGKNTITVGGYATRNSSPIYTGMTINDILSYSSFGTLNDGRELPHICAPGQALISSFSKYYVEKSSEYSSYYEPLKSTVTSNGNKNYWSHMGGTSMATPVMTGVACLWLQADPTLTPDEIRQIAISTAATDSYVTSGNAYSPVQWGAGKLDALAGIRKILSQSSVESIIDNGCSPFIIDRIGNIFKISAAAGAEFTVSLINLAGQTISSAQSSNGDAVLNAGNHPSGIYILNLASSQATESHKIIID